MSLFKYIAIGLFALLLNLQAGENAVKFNQNVLLPKTEEVINLLNQEIYKNTNTEIAVFAITDSQLVDYEKMTELFLNDYKDKSYFALFFVLDIKKIDLRISDDLKETIDKNEIYWDYIVPLLTDKQNELNPDRISAIILNGVIGFGEQIAEAKKLHINLLDELTKGNTTFDITKYIFYFMALSLVGLFIYRMKRG